MMQKLKLGHIVILYIPIIPSISSQLVQVFISWCRVYSYVSLFHILSQYSFFVVYWPECFVYLFIVCLNNVNWYTFLSYGLVKSVKNSFNLVKVETNTYFSWFRGNLLVTFSLDIFLSFNASKDICSLIPHLYIMSFCRYILSSYSLYF